MNPTAIQYAAEIEKLKDIVSTVKKMKSFEAMQILCKHTTRPRSKADGIALITQKIEQLNKALTASKKLEAASAPSYDWFDYMLGKIEIN
jgi:hypothetical protein